MFVNYICTYVSLYRLYSTFRVTNLFFYIVGSNDPSREISKSKLNYKSQTLRIATNKFCATNKIGRGGFGSVYKVMFQLSCY